MRIQRFSRLALLSLSLGAAAIVAPRAAHAETDTFGIGNGHSGAYVAAAADEVINVYAPLTADAAKGATSITIGTSLPRHVRLRGIPLYARRPRARRTRAAGRCRAADEMHRQRFLIIRA